MRLAATGGCRIPSRQATGAAGAAPRRWEGAMFCPSCGTRNPDGSRFCGACGADLSARGAGSTPQAMAGTPQAAGAPTPTRPAAAARGRVSRRRVVTGVAVVVAVALVVAVGLRTSWFGLVERHVSPGIYEFVCRSSDTEGYFIASISQDGYIGLTDRDDWARGWNRSGSLQVNRTKNDHLHGEILYTEENSRHRDLNNFVVPQDAQSNLVGTWAFWQAREDGSCAGLLWAEFSHDGTFKYESLSSPDDATPAVALIMVGAFRGSSHAKIGQWTRRDGGDYLLYFADGKIYTYSHHSF